VYFISFLLLPCNLLYIAIGKPNSNPKHPHPTNNNGRSKTKRKNHPHHWHTISPPKNPSTAARIQPNHRLPAINPPTPATDPKCTEPSLPNVPPIISQNFKIIKFYNNYNLKNEPLFWRHIKSYGLNFP
jgi:hypothetical protein